MQKTEAESWKLENPQNLIAVTELEQKIRELNEELLSKIFFWWELMGRWDTGDPAEEFNGARSAVQIGES